MSTSPREAYRPRLVQTGSGSKVALYQGGTRGASVVVLGGIQYQRMFETPLGQLLADEAFAARVTLIDLPGLGNSRPGKEVTMETWLSDLSEAYANIAAGRSIWIGASMGAWLMFLLQERKPEWFHSMCGLAPALDWDLNFSDRIPASGTSGSALITVLDGVRLPARLLWSMRSYHLSDRPYRLRCPAHIIQGTRDQYDQRGTAASFASALGSECTVELVDDDHAVAKLGSAVARRSFSRWLRNEVDRVSSTSQET